MVGSDRRPRIDTELLSDDGAVVGVGQPISVTFDGSVDQATRVVGEEIPLNFGQATATRDPRQIQVGIKLFFD